jgi:hypothetical protein
MVDTFEPLEGFSGKAQNFTSNIQFNLDNPN